MNLCGLLSCSADKKATTVETVMPGSTIVSQVSDLPDTEDLNHVRYSVDVFEKVVLPKKLLEISGLAIDENNLLYAVNDEKAIIFKLSQEGEILDAIDFGKDGDYEGVEKVDSSIFILKSNGKVVEFDLARSEKKDSYNNPLSLTNDTEGLGYDRSTHSLLIAGKGSPNISHNPKLKKTKAVYAFNLNSKKLSTEPVLIISDDDIERYLKENKEKGTSKKKYKRRVQRATDFSPSAIAHNTVDGNYYLLSTVGKTLIVIDKTSTIKWIYYLDASAYIQPEGICFDSDGTMFISNEGKGLKSNLLKISKPTK